MFFSIHEFLMLNSFWKRKGQHLAGFSIDCLGNTWLDTLGLPRHMCLNKGLSHQLAPDCETRPPPLLHLYTEYRFVNLILKFADDTTVVRLISKGDELAYRDAILKLAA